MQIVKQIGQQAVWRSHLTLAAVTAIAAVTVAVALFPPHDSLMKKDDSIINVGAKDNIILRPNIFCGSKKG